MVAALAPQEITGQSARAPLVTPDTYSCFFSLLGN